MAKDYFKEFEELIMIVAKEGASDLHISVGRHPTIRVSRELIPLVKKDVLTPDAAQGLVYAMLNADQQAEFEKNRELDFSYNYEDKIRFRVNIFHQRGFVSAAMRLIPVGIRPLRDLGLPDILQSFTRKEQGFFLVVGPTGQGKSTTLAGMVDIINHERAEHIITVEDPIEYIFVQDKSIIDQREVRSDTKDFSLALRSMFREDVNVAMIGEMRDYETIAAAVTAAETGHLIFSSLHTNNAAQTIDRILDSFPPAQQNQIRSQLSNSIIGIFSQRLVPRVSGGLIPAYELLIANNAVRNLIRENKIHEIDLIIETSAEQGMISFNRSLIELVRQGEITMETAMAYSLNPASLQSLAR
jgi:twitching motility protein PilT